MNTKHPTTDTPIDADLQALADEIAATTGASPATALELARRQQPALQQFAQEWDVDAACKRALARRRRRTLLPPADE